MSDRRCRRHGGGAADTRRRRRRSLGRTRGERLGVGGTPLAPTRLVALPQRTLANGTDPLTVTLSAPVSPTSPSPTLIPGVAGAWHVVGDSDVFTPVLTLLPCSSYTLIVWARTDSSGYAAAGAQTGDPPERPRPPAAGLQQARRASATSGRCSGRRMTCTTGRGRRRAPKRRWTPTTPRTAGSRPTRLMPRLRSSAGSTRRRRGRRGLPGGQRAGSDRRTESHHLADAAV